MKRFELSTLSLARRCSTTELHPQKQARSRLKQYCTKEGPLVKLVEQFYGMVLGGDK